jgi:hypothetical protein
LQPGNAFEVINANLLRRSTQYANGNSSSLSLPDKPTLHRRDITFADEVQSPRLGQSNGGNSREAFLEQRTTEQQIAFVENQRDPRAKPTLRIPGPRDFDRGDLPQQVDEDEGGNDDDERLHNPTSPESLDIASNGHIRNKDQIPPLKHNITINEPERPQRGRSRSTWHHLNRSQGETNSAVSPNPGLRPRSTTRTLRSFLSSESHDREPMPYLSWQPTIGRNSVFIDLTEEQREELGGIEYRALKTLAFTLVSK